MALGVFCMAMEAVRRVAVSLLLLLLLVAGAAPVAAHHSRSDVDETKRVTLTGTLTKVDWRNPHIEFSIDSKGASDQIETWSIESASPSALALRKITKAMFERAIGKTISVEVSTARDGSRYGTSWKITFPDGTSAVMRQ